MDNNFTIDLNAIRGVQEQTPIAPQPDTSSIDLNLIRSAVSSTDSPIDLNAIRSASSVDTTDYLLNQGYQGLASVGAGVMRGAAGLVNALDPTDSEIADPVFKASDTLMETAKNSFGVTPQQQETASFPQKVAGALVQGATQLPLYANPATAVVAITAPALAQATEMMRENNLDTGDTQAIFGMKVASNVVGYKVATTFPNTAGATGKEIAKNYAKTLTATPAVNILSGGLEDVGTHELLKDQHPELAEKFKFSNWEQRAIEGITGVVMGGGMKYLHDKGAKTNYEKLLEQKRNFEEVHKAYSDSFPTLFNEIKDGATDVAKGTQAGLRGVEKQFARPYKDIDERQHSQYSLADYLVDIRKSELAKDPEFADYIKTLEALENLDYSTISRSTVHINNDSTGEGGVVHLNKDVNTPPEFVVTVPEIKTRTDLATVTHEVGHVVTLAMIKKIDSLTPDQLTKSPRLASLKDQLNSMRAAYDIAVAKTGKQIYERAMKDAPEWTKKHTYVDIGNGQKVMLFDHNNKTVADFEMLGYFLQKSPTGSNFYGLTDFNEFIASSFEALNPRTIGDKRANRGLGELTKQERSVTFGEDPNAVTETVPIINWKPASSFEFKQLYKQAADIFKPLMDNSFLKAQWDGVHRLASEQAKTSIDYKKLVDRAQDMDKYARHTLIEIGHTLDNSDSMAEFVIRLEAMSSLPAWREFALQNADLIYKNRHLIQAKAAVAKYTRDTELPTKGFTESYDSVDDLMRALPKDPTGQKDLPDSWNRWLIGPNQRTLMNLPPMAGKILRFFHRQMDVYNELEAKVYNSMMQHMDAYNALPEGNKKNVMDMAYRIDGSWGMRKEMAAREMWWPDEAFLKQYFPKASDQEIHAYLQLGEMEARAYKLLEAIAAKNGEPPPPRIPGHMPRVWKGAYKVFVEMEKVQLDKEGNPIKNDKGEVQTVKFTERVMSFPNKWRAQAFAKEVQSGKFGKDFSAVPDKYGEVVRVHTLDDWEKSIIPSMMQDQKAYNDFLTYAPEDQARVMAMDNAHAIGFQKHLETRSNVKGYMGEFSDKNYTFTQRIMGEKYRDRRDYLAISEKYAKGVAETFKNTMFTKDVYNRLYKNNTSPIEDKRPDYSHITSHFKVLAEHLSEVLNNYTGHADNKFKPIDNLLTDLSIKAGIPPYTYRQVAKSIRDMISLVFTRYNPGNWIMNYVQPSHTLSILTFVNEQRRRQGLSVGDVGKVTGELFKKGGLGKDEQAALAWAADNHILDPQAEHQVRAKAVTKRQKAIEALTLGKIPNAIEADARSTSFLIAYKYFSQVIDDPTVARRSAAEVMGMTMVNYDRSHRPLMYQSFGVTGELLSPFAVYRNAWMANTAMMVKFAMDRPLEFRAYKPFLVAQALYVMSAGLTGAIGIGEYDSLIRMLKKFSPDTFGDWPDAASIFKKMGMSDTIRYGMLAESTKYFPGTPTGVSIGGSGAAVSLDDMVSVNTVPFIASLMSLGSLGATYLAGKTPTSSAKYEALSGLLPGQARAAMNEYFQEPGVKTAFAAKTLTGNVHTTYADRFTQAVWGKSSLPVKDEESRIRNAKAVGDKHTADVKRLVEKAADSFAGSNSRSYEEFAAEAANNYGISPDEFFDMVTEKRLDRQLPYLEKIFRGSESIVKYKKLDQYNQMR